MPKKNKNILSVPNLTIQKDKLNQYTFARVNLPKSGFAIGINDVLAFRADHAAARDAIFTPFTINEIKKEISSLPLEFTTVASKAESKEDYLKRPDLGKELTSDSLSSLQQLSNNSYTIAITITNGLSATAVNENASTLLQHFIPKLTSAGISIAPIVFAQNGRVAIADQIGETLNATISIILVGERPGLSSPNSMSAYFTYAPKTGLTDEAHNCISNIRKEGFAPALAAEKLFYLVNASLTKKISGIHLKDDMGLEA